MAFFKFRFPGGKAGSDAIAPAPPESVDGLRRRARHRLIGAAVLVLAAVIGFPLLFDTQPRPVAVDVPIQIPDRAKAKPLALPAPVPVPVPEAPASAAVVTPSVPAQPVAVAAAPVASQVAAPASLGAREEIVPSGSVTKQAYPSASSSSSAINKEVVRVPAPTPKPEPKAETVAQAAASADDGSRARALLDGKDVGKPAAADAGRFIVQIGAFADATLARETRLKVERAGLTTYTQVADTKEGKRIRVRVGPFSSRAEADKAAAKIRSLALSAAILTL